MRKICKIHGHTFFLFEFVHNSSGSKDNRPFVNDPKIFFYQFIGNQSFFIIRGDAELNKSLLILQK
jgi:hypothetical protein